MVAIAKQGRRNKILLVTNCELRKLLVILAESRVCIYLSCRVFMFFLWSTRQNYYTYRNCRTVSFLNDLSLEGYKNSLVSYCPTELSGKKIIELHWSTQQCFCVWNNIEALDTIWTLNSMQSKITRAKEIFTKPK